MKELRWLGPLLDCSGYASAGRGYIRACEFGNVRVQARDRSRSLNLKNKGIDEGIMAMYEKLYLNEVSNLCPTVQHQVPDCFFRDSKTNYSIGYTIFEMLTIPENWVPYCNMMDVIWTGSAYSRASFLNTGVKTKIEVLPHAIDTDVYSPQATPWTIKNKRGFTFLSVFDFTERKAWKTLLKAYWNAFTNKDDVCLVLKVYYGGFSEENIKEVLRKIKTFKEELKLNNTPPILIYGHDVQDRDMPGLYRSADCYVGVSREGFGLPYAEAMSCGVACIGPEVGGNREYMNEENSFLVRYSGDSLVGRETSSTYPQFSSIKWANHSEDHLTVLMKLVAQQNGLRTEKAKKGREFILNNLTLERIGHKINSLLP